jgi:hypothetical protein
MPRDEAEQLPQYRVIQLEWNARRGFSNEGVENFDDLVTHHPESNRRAEVERGVVVNGEEGRAHALIGGEIQEIEVVEPGRNYGLQLDQVLLKKDFMLEDSRLPTGPGSRAVDVPSPVSGVIGTVNHRSGLVDILDQEGGEVIARIRHMRDIPVESGDRIQYGQAVGTQSDRAADAIHVHMEIDTRHYQQYENYMADLVSGRLSIDPARQTAGIEARPVLNDGTVRIGESSGTVLTVQQHLNAEGFRGADNRPLQEDGVYRLSMQAAVINYQAARGLPQTGDIDQVTLNAIAPRIFPPEVNDPEQGRGVDPGLPRYLNPQGALPGNGHQGPDTKDPLHSQAQEAVRRLDASMGREYDEHSACMAASAACLAKG